MSSGRESRPNICRHTVRVFSRLRCVAGAAGYQRAIVEQFRGSDVVLISEYHLTELSSGMVAVLHTEFIRSGEVGRYQVSERITN